MIENIEKLIDNGCSRRFIEIVKKFNISTINIDDLEEFIDELEQYQLDEKVCLFEQDVLEKAKKMHSLSEQLVLDDASTENAIKRAEIDYNGDTFTADGYEFNTDDGRRY
jgi:MoaA/NifB/PqqE/SkfB family radical SAM enzyme